MKDNLRYLLVFCMIVGVLTVVYEAQSALQRCSGPSCPMSGLVKVQPVKPLRTNLAQPETILAQPATIDLGMPERRVSAASR